MLNKIASVMAAGLAAALAAPRVGGEAAELLDFHTSRLGTPSPVGCGYRSRLKKRATLGRKLHRTTKAEGSYGRNLRAHFDKHRLTRAERNRFYAGKAI